LWTLIVLAALVQPARAQDTQPSAESSLIANILNLPLAAPS
jgi:hypothetical protein